MKANVLNIVCAHMYMLNIRYIGDSILLNSPIDQMERAQVKFK